MAAEPCAAPNADVRADAYNAYDDVYATFAKEGGRVGSGALGAGTGGVARCAR